MAFRKKKLLAEGEVKPKKKRRKKIPFDIEQCMDIAEVTLKEPVGWREEQGPLGDFVTSFFVPLDVCPTINVYLNMYYKRRAGLKEKALRMMFEQYGRRRPTPLPGRPVIILVRFSSKEPDHETSWHKIIVDRLIPKHDGLNIIVDDNPNAVDLRGHYWRYAPKKKGFGYVEIWTGRGG